MAIYHMESKIVSRGTGRSVVAASAYMSCSRLYNDYDGVQHDYTRKQGLVWQEVFLPPQTPREWLDREQLWNAVEAAEMTKDSRLAREIIVALPIELNHEEQIALTGAYISQQFVADGMCADVAIHDTDRHNPHAHILLTMRPLNEDGTWQYKTEKEYLCMKDGEERGFTAAEYKSAQTNGWEKQYLYRVGRKKVYMTQTAATEHGYARVDKHPKSSRYGRQNPITARWNSEEQLVAWREAWADMANRAIEQAGIGERIDHRSHAARGFDEQPTIHEGVEAMHIEEKGFVSERRALNRQIRADNALLRELKEQIRQLGKAVQMDIPRLADMLEKLRADMVIFCYQLSHIREGREKGLSDLRLLRQISDEYGRVDRNLRETRKARKVLIAEKRELSPLHVFKHKELAAQIAEKTEDIEELKTRRASILRRAGCKEDAGSNELHQRMATIEGMLQKLDEQERRFSALSDQTRQKYADLQRQAAQVDADKMNVARQSERVKHQDAAKKKLEETFGERYSPMRMIDSRKQVEQLTKERGSFGKAHVRNGRRREETRWTTF